MATVCVSHYHESQELSWTEHGVTAEGLAEARAALAIKNAPGFRRVLSPWQFAGPWAGQMDEACRLLLADDVAGLTAHLRQCEPRT